MPHIFEKQETVAKQNTRKKKNCTRWEIKASSLPEICVCVCVCVHVYVVYEDTNLYNDMGMTGITRRR